VAVILAAAAASAGAQSKTVNGETRTVTATVEAIEKASREVTVKKPDGKYDVIYVPQTIKRFDSLKVGDTITARYYETMVLQLKKEGEKDVDTSASAAVPTTGALSGTVSHQQKFTATISAIDMNTPSVTFTGPHNWSYSSRVKDKAALSKVKVGDKVDITWTAAVLVSVDEAK
jgi:Cu/Ag efflux protein CusF